VAQQYREVLLRRPDW